MTQFSYDRKYELIIGEPFIDLDPTLTDGLDLTNDYKGGLIGLETSNVSTVLKPVNLTKVNKVRETVITDLHIEAKMSSGDSKGSKGQFSTIDVYNLSETTKNSVAKVGNRVILKAGYESDSDALPIIIIGTVDDVRTVKMGQDTVTTFFIKDGSKSRRAVRGVISVPKGKSYKDVFLACIDLLRKDGIAVAEVVLENAEYPEWFVPLQLTPADVKLRYKGYNFSGKISKCLDDLCEMFGYRWDIINEALYIHPASYGQFRKTFTLTPDNILSIEGQEKTESVPKSATSSGYIVRILLDGRVDKKSKVVIEGMEKENGSYRVVDIKHTFTYEGQDCYTELEISR